MESYVQLTMEEYDILKKNADKQNLPVEIGVMQGDWKVLEYNIRIDMRELKLKICEQRGIDPSISVVNFY